MHRFRHRQHYSVAGVGRLNTFVRRKCPHCGAVIEFCLSDCSSGDTLLGLCGACDAVLPIEPQTTIHVASPLDRLKSLSLATRNVSATVFFPESLLLLRQHFLLLFGHAAALAMLWLAIIAIPSWILTHQSIANRESQWLMIVIGLGVGFLALMVTAYVVVVLVQICLQVVRHGGNSHGPRMLYRELLWSVWRSAPPSVVFRTSGLLLLGGGCLLFTLTAAMVWMIAAAMIFETKAATSIGIGGASILVFVVVFTMQWLLWPAVFLIADEREDLVTSIAVSVQLSVRHAKMSMVLMILYAALATVGSFVFYVGQILVLPVALVPMAMGYLAMTGGTMTPRCMPTLLQKSRPWVQP